MKLQNKILLLALVALAGCSSVKKELGVDRNSPDEFMVVKRAPLTLPPDYSLRPPSDANIAAPSDAVTTAESAVMGDSKKTVTAKPAAGDKAFLGSLGADADNGDIRRKIDEDNGYISLENRSLADKLSDWKDGDSSAVVKDHAPVSTVDAAAEADRLKKNKAEGKPVNEGDVPVIKKTSGTLDKIF